MTSMFVFSMVSKSHCFDIAPFLDACSRKGML